jgi:hypothetical protein
MLKRNASVEDRNVYFHFPPVLSLSLSVSLSLHRKTEGRARVFKRILCPH